MSNGTKLVELNIHNYVRGAFIASFLHFINTNPLQPPFNSDVIQERLCGVFARGRFYSRYVEINITPSDNDRVIDYIERTKKTNELYKEFVSESFYKLAELGFLFIKA